MKNITTLLLTAAVAFSLSACAGTNERTPGILELDRDAAAGSTVYENNCMSCHGADLTGESGPDITGAGDAHEDSEIVDLVLNGGIFMPSFADQLDDQEVADLMGYLRTQW